MWKRHPWRLLPRALILFLWLAAGALPGSPFRPGRPRPERQPVLESIPGGYLVSLDGRACLEFDVPELPGCPPAAVEVTPCPASSGAPEGVPSWYRVRMKWDAPEPIHRDELALRFRWLIKPDFWWAPHLAPGKGYVIAQHVFRSPAIIGRAGPLTVVVVPDLDLVGRREDTPWYLDLNAPAAESWLGLARTEVAEHVLFRKVPGMTIPAGKTEVGFFVTAYRDGAAVGNPWGVVSRFLWDRWAQPLFRAGQPIRAPLGSFIHHAYRWAFETWGRFVWQEFTLNGRRVGAPQFIVNVSQSPNYPGDWFQREFLSIWNQAWFSSLRSASGLYRYARRTGDETLLERARLTKEFALSAPLTDGLFPAVLRTDNVKETLPDGKTVERPKPWATAYWTNSDRCPENYGISPDWYHVLDMSWTALLLLRWYEELEPDTRLLDYARAYGDRLISLQDRDGFFPGWLHPRTHKPGSVMNRTPETSLSVTFLLNLAQLTGVASYRAAALKALDSVISEIVPAGRWEDFETYWSCCSWGRDTQLGRRVERNDIFKQCSFSMFWTAEACLAAFRATGRRGYLGWGRRTLDELSMVQQVWQPPFIHVPALGGFGVMNCDGEWNDSRETLFAELFLDYSRETGDRDLFERGLAALRAGFVMMYCPENPEVKALWEKVYPWFGPEDYGFTMENYGHGGRTSPEGEGMGTFTIYDWGNGAAAEAANRILDHYGQVYVDRPRGLAFGVDAVEVTPVPGGWRVSDRTGAERTLRVVFEDGTAKAVVSGDWVLSPPDRD
jgi:hypothetical protein